MWKICMLFCYVLYKKIDSLGKHAAAGREREAVHIQQLGNCKHKYTLCVEWIGAENCYYSYPRLLQINNPPLQSFFITYRICDLVF